MKLVQLDWEENEESDHAAIGRGLPAYYTIALHEGRWLARRRIANVYVMLGFFNNRESARFNCENDAAALLGLTQEVHNATKWSTLGTHTLVLIGLLSLFVLLGWL